MTFPRVHRTRSFIFAGFNTESCKNAPKSIRKPVISDWFNGADGRIRTGDLILTKDALYLLSYISAVRAFVERRCYYTTPAPKKQYLSQIFYAVRGRERKRARRPKGTLRAMIVCRKPRSRGINPPSAIRLSGNDRRLSTGRAAFSARPASAGPAHSIPPARRRPPWPC